MKNEFHKKCLKWSLICFGIIAASIIFYLLAKDISGIAAVLKNFISVFDSIIIGLVFAYITNPLVRLFQRIFEKFKRPLKPKFLRAVSVFSTYSVIIILLAVLFWLLIPELIVNIGRFISNFRLYISKFSDFAEGVASELPYGIALFNTLNRFIVRAAGYITQWFDTNLIQIVNVVYQTTDTVITFLVAFFISIYISYSRDTLVAQIKKSMIAFLPRNWCDNIMKAAYVVNDSFSGYMSGVFLSAVIIGILCYLCTTICSIAYAPLISFIVMITDIIPYFGPFIGAVIGAVLLVLVSPYDALYFLIIIIILQQLTSNFINPRIIGKTTGLDSVYVILSILVMGGLFGIIGTIIGVPIFVIILKAIRKLIELKSKEENNE